jgi:hypothetical protein
VACSGRELEVLDPDVGDPELALVGDRPVAWAHGEVLTIAVRRPGDAPLLLGTVTERMRPAGDGCWAVRLRVPGLERACIEYGVLTEDAAHHEASMVWQGSRARRPPSPVWTAIGPLERHVVGGSELAAVHPVRFWSPPDPAALLVCADGDGLEAWAGLVAASGEPVALVGIESAGLSWRPQDLEDGGHARYDPSADPRARAYLPRVDPAYFAQHMGYVVRTVLPWADERLGRTLPRLAYGASNGAAWAAALGALHPDLVVGVLAFSLGERPPWPMRRDGPVHALVAGRLEPGFHRDTTSYARRLRRRGARVRLRTPLRGHDFTMWADELLPALRWALRAGDQAAGRALRG